MPQTYRMSSRRFPRKASMPPSTPHPGCSHPLSSADLHRAFAPTAGALRHAATAEGHGSRRFAPQRPPMNPPFCILTCHAVAASAKAVTCPEHREGPPDAQRRAVAASAKAGSPPVRAAHLHHGNPPAPHRGGCARCGRLPPPPAGARAGAFETGLSWERGRLARIHGIEHAYASCGRDARAPRTMRDPHGLPHSADDEGTRSSPSAG
jgi:hypothetical protein